MKNSHLEETKLLLGRIELAASNLESRLNAGEDALNRLEVRRKNDKEFEEKHLPLLRKIADDMDSIPSESDERQRE